MKRVLRMVLSQPFRLLPVAVRLRLSQLLFDSLLQQQPDKAVRSLLQLETDLSVRTDDAAQRYGGGIHVKHRLMAYHDFFVDRVEPGQRVLDVGCGYGAVAHSIAVRSRATVTGIDNNAFHIEQARALFQAPGLSFVFGDATVNLPNQTFDVIVLSNVLEHIEHRVEFLQRLTTQLAPSKWLIRVPLLNRDWRVPLRKELGMFYFSDGTHFTEYTVASFDEEMGAAGLSIAAIQTNWGEIWAEVRPANQGDK